MRSIPYYPNFECEVARKGIAMAEIAAEIEVTPRCLYNKMKGKRHFTWPEVDRIQKKFFPECTKDYLMQTRV